MQGALDPEQEAAEPGKTTSPVFTEAFEHPSGVRLAQTDRRCSLASLAEITALSFTQKESFFSPQVKEKPKEMVVLPLHTAFALQLWHC